MGKKALLLVDIQNGFCPGGNLAVPEGDQVVPVANELIAKGGYDLVVASQDWHPANHGSFASQHEGKKPFEMGELSGKPQMMWTDHCVQGTKDAEFHPDLNMAAVQYIQQKGQNTAVDSYSAFRDNDQAALTGLADYLKAQGVTELDVCGLATDYCVKFSALDAKDMLPGVKVRFIEDASRGISPDGIAAAKAEMATAGIETVQSKDVITPGKTTSGNLQADGGRDKQQAMG
jgi:nicotinamidase/pyrazinamidase